MPWSDYLIGDQEKHVRIKMAGKEHVVHFGTYVMRRLLW